MSAHTGGPHIAAASRGPPPSPRAAARDFLETGARIGAGKCLDGPPKCATAGFDGSPCAGSKCPRWSSNIPPPNSERKTLPPCDREITELHPRCCPFSRRREVWSKHAVGQRSNPPRKKVAAISPT